MFSAPWRVLCAFKIFILHHLFPVVWGFLKGSVVVQPCWFCRHSIFVWLNKIFHSSWNIYFTGHKILSCYTTSCAGSLEKSLLFLFLFCVYCSSSMLGASSFFCLLFLLWQVCVFICACATYSGRSQRTTCGNQSSPSPMWVPGIEPRSLGLVQTPLFLEPSCWPILRLCICLLA